MIEPRKKILLAIVLVSAAGACSATSEPEGATTMSPPPDDTIVVDASEATTSETGVARWGITTKTGSSETVLHAYGPANERLAEIRQAFTLRDPDHATIAITMTGAKGEAAMRVELTATKSGDDARVDAEVVDNTFASAPGAQALLARLKADTGSAGASVGSGSLVGAGQTKPKESQQLVQPCQQAVQSCGQQLTRVSQAAGRSADSCSKLVRSATFTLICAGAGALIGGIAGGIFGVGAGALPGAWGGAATGTAVCAELSGFGNNGFDCVADSVEQRSAQGDATRCQQSASSGCSATP